VGCLVVLLPMMQPAMPPRTGRGPVVSGIADALSIMAEKVRKIPY
jgi:hypothetical protein